MPRLSYFSLGRLLPQVREFQWSGGDHNFLGAPSTRCSVSRITITFTNGSRKVTLPVKVKDWVGSPRVEKTKIIEDHISSTTTPIQAPPLAEGIEDVSFVYDSARTCNLVFRGPTQGSRHDGNSRKDQTFQRTVRPSLSPDRWPSCGTDSPGLRGPWNSHVSVVKWECLDVVIPHRNVLYPLLDFTSLWGYGTFVIVPYLILHCMIIMIFPFPSIPKFSKWYLKLEFRYLRRKSSME